MADSVAQLQVPERGGPFQLVSVERPAPGPDEISIRTKAVGLNPLDWKSRAFGVMVQHWPAVFGVDAAGVVDAVGENVNNFKVGDEVFTLCGMSNRAGAFQEIIIVPSNQAAKKPSDLSFEEAASIPIAFVTGAAAVHDGIKVTLPFVESANTGEGLRSILVLGGSSAVGATAIQLLRASLPNAVILTTSSSAHHDRLISLGATKAFDRSADPSDFKAATPDGAGVDAILDAVTAAVGNPDVFSALSASGPKTYAFVVTGQNPEVPDGVSATQVFGRALFKHKGGALAIPAVAQLVESGKYKLPARVEVAGRGLGSIDEALGRLQKGVSGTKLVVSI